MILLLYLFSFHFCFYSLHILMNAYLKCYLSLLCRLVSYPSFSCIKPIQYISLAEVTQSSGHIGRINEIIISIILKYDHLFKIQIRISKLLAPNLASQLLSLPLRLINLLPFDFSINTLAAIVLIIFLLRYLNFMNLCGVGNQISIFKCWIIEM